MDCLLGTFKKIFTEHYFPKILISQTAFWGVAMFVLKNHTLVDVAWGTNQLLIGYSFFAANGFKGSYVGFAILAIWALRLSGFIFYNRIWKPYVDPRYEILRRQRNEIFYFLFQFQLQGILLTLTSIPLYFAFQERKLTNFNYFGIALCIIGIIGEAIADYQLQNYKNTRSNSQGIFRGGLFKHSRHPNLFFELTFWVGMGIFAINTSNYCSLLSLLGPTLLFLIIKNITVRVTTKHMIESKPEFKQVLKETHMFWPFSSKI